MTQLFRRMWPAALVVFLLGVTPAFAQHEKGDVSLGGYGTVMLMKIPDPTTGESSTSGIGFVGAQLGKFIRSNTEVGALSQITFFTGSGESGTTGTLGGYGKYYFGTDKTRPYVGGQLVVNLRPEADRAAPAWG